MAFFFGDGWELYSAIGDAVSYWDSVGSAFAITPTGRFAGSRGLVNASTGAGPVKTSTATTDPVHHIVCAFQQTAALSGSTLGAYFQLSDGATNQCCIVFRSDGAILLTSATPAGTVLDTWTGAVTAPSTWYGFEFEVVINASTGSWAARKNGNTSNDHALGSLNTRPGTNTQANKLTIGQQAAVTNHFLDDVLWRSDASSVAFAGDIRCYTRMPAADSSVAWTRSGSTFQMQPFAGSTLTGGSILANNSRYTPLISQGGTIGSVIVNMTAGYTGNMKCAIYASSSGQPGAVLQSATAVVNNPTTTNTFIFSPAVSIAKGTQFFVAVCTDTTTGSFFAVANTAPYSTIAFSASSPAYASWPAANPSVASAAAYPFFPVVTPTYNADMAAEAQQDSASSYNLSSTVSQSDLYTLQPIGSTPSSIVGVTTRGYMQKSDAGTRAAAVQLQSGATNVQATPLALPAGSWGWNWRTDTVDPNTSAAWTAAAVNSATIGAIVTT